MGKRGPAPTPTGLRLVRGDRKDRINTNEPQPTEGVPHCPMEASEEVHSVWKYTMEQLQHMRIITPADRDALYAYCEAVVMHRIASSAIANEGLMQMGGNGSVMKHPAFQVQRESAAQIRSFAGEFGLTPSARSTIKLHTSDAADEKSAARLLSS